MLKLFIIVNIIECMLYGKNGNAAGSRKISGYVFLKGEISMNEAKTKADAFLKKYGMHYDSIDIIRESKIFIDEMEKGLSLEKSSLKMLPTYISLDKDIPAMEPVIVMDAGGTNFRIAVVHFDSSRQPVVEDFRSYAMPGTNGEISKEEFFSTIAGYLAPVFDKSDKIGFCFSYPTEILKNKDGRLITLVKEVKVRDIEGEVIGAALLQKMKEMGYESEKKIVLLNDSAATLLGGKAAFQNREFDSFIGFILGTGLNACYLEENKNIIKDEFLSSADGNTLVNIESGGYSKAPRGTIDERFDSHSGNPGSQQLEKMISGAYQGGLMLEIIREAVSEGLFSAHFSNNICNVKVLHAREIDEFCFYPYLSSNVLAGCIGSGENAREENDRLTLYYIINDITERAAKLVAVNLGAVIIKTQKGKNPCKPVCITADGSAFYKSKLFKTKLDYYVKEVLNDKMDIYCEFVKVDNANLIGTAIAGILS